MANYNLTKFILGELVAGGLTMRAYRTRILLTVVAVVAASAANAFQFSTLSSGVYDSAAMLDVESVQAYYYNGIAPIPLITFTIDGNTDTGSLSGPGNVDVLNFQIQAGTLQNLGASQNVQVSWQYVSGTGAFAGLTGLGSISVDALPTDATHYQTTSGLTGELVAAPEPASLVALGIGAAAILRRRRKA